MKTNNTLFYVTAKVMKDKYLFLLGPFDIHDEALSWVRACTNLCIKSDPRAPFWEYGTAGRNVEDPLIQGVLNEVLL